MVVVLPVPVRPTTKMLKPGLWISRPIFSAEMARGWPMISGLLRNSLVVRNPRDLGGQCQRNFSGESGGNGFARFNAARFGTWY